MGLVSWPKLGPQRLEDQSGELLHLAGLASISLPDSQFEDFLHANRLPLKASVDLLGVTSLAPQRFKWEMHGSRISSFSEL
jgi:hypothetical protein